MKIKKINIIPLLLFGLLSSAPDIYANWPTDRDMNPLHMVVVFTKFKDEAPGDTLAPEWADEIFSGEPGSVNHFYEKVSFGIYRITGEYLPKRYELPDVAEVYIQNRNKYARDVLNLLNNDPDVDFSKFDTNGPDGIPGSSDDDHFVDYMVLMPKTRPYDFILRYATGVWTLGIIETFKTKNKSSDGFIIQLDKFSGSIATANSRNEAVGTIVAEIGHAYGSGAVDLMDKNWVDNATDSAGVGYWDFLGRGALGWEDQNGPMGPCAFTRMRMDCAGRYNTNLIYLQGFNERVPIKDVGKEKGIIYKIDISPSEYFLIEYRRSDGLYYDLYIPQDGLLIWHVLDTETNNNEFKKSMLDKMEILSGNEITQQIAGISLAPKFPQRGIVSAFLGAAAVGGPVAFGPKFLALFPLASPRVVGEFARALGIGKNAVDDIIKAVGAQKLAKPGFAQLGVQTGRAIEPTLEER